MVHPILKKLTTGVALTGGLVTLTSAQEAPDTTRQLTLTLSQRFEGSENRRLEDPSEGSSFTSRTTLGIVGLFRDEISEFRLRTSTGLRYTNDFDGSNKSDVDDPRLNVSYNRSGLNSDVRFGANYRRQDISFIRPLDDFIDENGILNLPDDSDSLQGDGTRIDYGANVNLTVLKDARASLSFSLGTNRREYEDVTDPDLFDRTTDRFGIATNLNFDKGFTGRLAYNASYFRADDAVDTERDRQTLSFTINRELSPVLSMQATLALREIQTRTNTRTETNDGLSGGLRFTLDRPSGTIALAYSSNTVTNGTRHRLNLSHDYTLKLGSLQSSIGLTSLNSDPAETTANIRYSIPLRESTANVQFSRNIRFSDADNADRDVTTLALGYTKNINSLSSYSLRTSFSSSDETDRGLISASYRYDLTEDWSLNSGYSFRTRSTSSEDAESHTIFVSINRSFDLPY